MVQLIYVVEDDESIRDLIKIVLENGGYKTMSFETAETALLKMSEKKPDLMIFDIMLPGMDGLAAVKKIRKETVYQSIPILMLTAKDGEVDKVMGLDGGADDYMTKPFSVLELSARVRTLLRRSSRKEEQPLLEIRDLTINLDKRQVRKNGILIELSYKEYELLLYLIHNQYRVVSRDELFEKIWKMDFVTETRTLDVHVRLLRQKLNDDGTKYIKTVRGVGYCFLMEESADRDVSN